MELWYATDELREMWGVEYGLLKERYLQAVEYRSRINPGYKLLEVVAHAFKLQLGEGGKGGACWQRRMSAFWIRARSSGLEFEHKPF